MMLLFHSFTALLIATFVATSVGFTTSSVKRQFVHRGLLPSQQYSSLRLPPSPFLLMASSEQDEWEEKQVIEKDILDDAVEKFIDIFFVTSFSRRKLKMPTKFTDENKAKLELTLCKIKLYQDL